MIRILHTADLHLGAPFPELGEKEENRRHDLLQTFERLLTLAIKNEVHLFIVAGDLFDSPKPPLELIGKVQAGVKRLTDRGIVTVLLPGGHDGPAGADSVYRRHEFPGAVLLSAASVAAPVALQVAGREVFLYGCPGTARGAGAGLHLGVLREAFRDESETDAGGVSLAALREWNLDYVALGWQHNFATLAEWERLYGCYPGSPEGLRFGENGPRFCALATVEPGRATVDPLPVGGRVLDELTLDLSGCATPAEVVEKIHELRGSDLLLRLTLTGVVEAPLDPCALREQAAGDFYHLELLDRTQLLASEFAGRIEAEETVRGVLTRRARRLLAETPPERRPVVEEAFREVLLRFQSFDGGRP